MKGVFDFPDWSWTHDDDIKVNCNKCGKVFSPVKGTIQFSDTKQYYLDTYCRGVAIWLDEGELDKFCDCIKERMVRAKLMDKEYDVFHMFMYDKKDGMEGKIDND